MFTGIIESMAEVVEVRPDSGNVDLVLSSSLTHEFRIDQSVSHNGVCLTVVGIEGDRYTVTAVHETLNRSNLGKLVKGDKVNLERSMLMNGRLDGHMVQGHVDTVGVCESITEDDGSWIFRFTYPGSYDNLIVEKGSVCVNGVSLTVASCDTGFFTVAVIPYTFSHTNFGCLRPGDPVNLEFDILGKYVLKALGKFS